MAVKHTPKEIEVFALTSRIKKLRRQLESEMIQGNLWPPMQDELQKNVEYEIKRLQNRLNRALEKLQNERI